MPCIRLLLYGAKHHVDRPMFLRTFLGQVLISTLLLYTWAETERYAIVQLSFILLGPGVEHELNAVRCVSYKLPLPDASQPGRCSVEAPIRRQQA
jgi:hypothetical protein